MEKQMDKQRTAAAPLAGETGSPATGTIFKSGTAVITSANWRREGTLFLQEMDIALNVDDRVLIYADPLVEANLHTIGIDNRNGTAYAVTEMPPEQDVTVQWEAHDMNGEV